MSADLATRCREAAENKALDIGTAWSLLEEAAEALMNIPVTQPSGPLASTPEALKSASAP